VGRYLAERYYVRQGDSVYAGVRSSAAATLLEALYLPDDEVCLYLFESESLEGVGAAGDFDRIAPVVQVTEPEA